MSACADRLWRLVEKTYSFDQLCEKTAGFTKPFVADFPRMVSMNWERDDKLHLTPSRETFTFEFSEGWSNTSVLLIYCEGMIVKVAAINYEKHMKIIMARSEETK